MPHHQLASGQFAHDQTDTNTAYIRQMCTNAWIKCAESKIHSACRCRCSSRPLALAQIISMNGTRKSRVRVRVCVRICLAHRMAQCELRTQIDYRY